MSSDGCHRGDKRSPARLCALRADHSVGEREEHVLSRKVEVLAPPTGLDSLRHHLLHTNNCRHKVSFCHRHWPAGLRPWRGPPPPRACALRAVRASGQRPPNRGVLILLPRRAECFLRHISAVDRPAETTPLGTCSRRWFATDSPGLPPLDRNAVPSRVSPAFRDIRRLEPP